MFRSNFSKKANATLKKGALSKPVSAIPTPHIHKVDQMNIPTKQHSGTISINDIKRFDFKTENGKNIFYIYLYDTLDQTDTGLPLDYMLKSDNTTDVDDFNGCSFLPLYAADGKDINKYVQPHFNEIIDMFDDIKEAGNFEETNPGATGQYEHLYDCVIVSPTRTQIHNGFKDGKVVFNHKLINSNATKGTTLWLGRTIKETVDGQEKDIAHFLKLKITKYVIENYYAGYGSIENTGVDYGTFVPVEQAAAEGIYVIDGVRVLKSTEFEFVNDGTLTTYTNTVHTNICSSTAKVANFIGKSDLETFTPINFYTEGTTTIPIMGCYNVPGYYNYLKSTENDSEQQILGSPLVVKVPTLITVTTANYAAFGTKKVQYDITVTGTAAAGYTVTMQNSFNGAEYYTVENGQMTRHLPDLAYKMTGGDIETNDSINYIPRKLNEILIQYLRNFNNLHLAGSPQFTVIKGTETTNNVKLQYYNGATFTNCEIDDAPETDKAIPPWYMNCTFPGSEVRLDNYNDVVKTITVIGDENENIIGFDDSSRLNPRLNPRFIRSGRGYNQQNKYIHIKDLDDLYTLLEVTHNRGILPEAPVVPSNADAKTCWLISTDKAITYTARNGNVPASLSLAERDTETISNDTLGNCYLFAEIQDDTNIIKFRLGIEVTEKAEYQVYKYDTTPDGPSYKPSETSGMNNIYYGIVGTEYGQKIQEINDKISTVVLGDNSTVTITPKVYEAITNQKTMSDLVKEFKTIFERMPLNSTFLYEISGILEKIYSFEANRVPYINQSTEATANTTPETSGFEKKDDSNVLKVTETSYTLRDGITVQKVEGADLYKFKEGGAHDKLIKSMENALLYCNGFCTTSDNEKIYSTLSSMMTQWENYYAGQAPDNSTDVSPTSIDNAEFEIYEDESVYKVFVASVDTGEVSVVTGLTSNGTKPEQGQTDPLVEFISSILKQMVPEVKEVMGYTTEGDIAFTLNDAVAYIDPESETGLTAAVKENKMLEYRAMLKTIQGARNALQRTGDTDSFLLKFLQTDKGTFFELLGKEPNNTAEIVQNEKIYAYYVAKGYQVEPTSDDQGRKDITPPRGRDKHYSKPIIKKEIKKEVTAIADNGTWRLVKIPKFYTEEPLDWFVDNYYSTFLYDQNTYNLSLTIDPEFVSRNKIIFTKDTTANDVPKEQNMIGYYLVDCKPVAQP